MKKYETQIGTKKRLRKETKEQKIGRTVSEYFDENDGLRMADSSDMRSYKIKY